MARVSVLAPGEWWRAQPPSSPPAGEGAVEAPGAAAPRDRASGSALAFRALLAFTFVMLIAPQTFFPAIRPFRIALLTGFVGIAAQVLYNLHHGRPLTVVSREMGLTAGLAIWSVVTLPLSYWPGGTASFLLDTYLKVVALFWLLANAVDTVPRLRRVAWALTVMAVPLALTGIKNFLSGEFIGGAVRRIAGYEAGLTANPNDLAIMLNLILPLSVALLSTARGALARVVLLTVVAVEVVGVVVTFSRGGFVTLAVMVGLYTWRLARRGRAVWAAIALAAAVAGLAVVPADYRARLTTITDIDSDATGSAQERWSDTLAAVRVVMGHPIIGGGVGMNTLALNQARTPKWTEVHNAYLQCAVDLGLPGLLLFLLLVVACLRKARRVRRRTEGVPALGELSALAEGVEIALLAYTVEAFFGPLAYGFYFYYLAGLAVAAGRVHDNLRAGVEPASTPAMAYAS
jgi:probable O-glycosylation ligase (exosortase A-associated)